MNLFKPTSTLANTAKTTSQHPWASRSKEVYLNNIKYAHNSVCNPKYPKETKECPPDENRTKFTVIGDRVHKDFIYCAHLVKHLYKYKNDVFEAPVIQGFNSVEWPTIWNDLKVNFKETFCLMSSVAVIMNDKFLGGASELRKLVESKFRHHLFINNYNESIAEFAKFVRGSGRPFAYMNIAINEKPIGSLIFMVFYSIGQLYADVLPYTSENFLRLCKDTKGGYSGTPIHRIVKDGWIQGGGFGLKETNLGCENFIIPHDRRGVLGMANSGLHMECSTQFFILLQPAPWMVKKFVAFGQLVEGKRTLEIIEAVPTWYESPSSNITIYRAGVFNMDCKDIMINKDTNSYIDKHIEDLNELGEIFYEMLMHKVFLTAQLRDLERLQKQAGEGAEDKEVFNIGLNEAQRFNRIKDDYDVETYVPEYEENPYSHQSIQETPSLKVKPKKPFYIPLTDVLYPDEKDSDFDLKRFLQGDYCLGDDIIEPAKTFIPKANIYNDLILFEESDNDSVDDGIDRNQARELKQRFSHDIARMSFAGDVVQNIGRSKTKLNIRDETCKNKIISDDQLRKLRLASINSKGFQIRKKNVSKDVLKPEVSDHKSIIKRKQSRLEYLESKTTLQKTNSEDDEDLEKTTPSCVKWDTDDQNVVGKSTTHLAGVRRSVFVRLFDEVSNEPPTLKDYRQTTDIHPDFFLKKSLLIRIEGDYHREGISSRNTFSNSNQEIPDFRHGKRESNKMSSEYMKTIDHIERHQALDNSIRRGEYYKQHRPSMSIPEYQLMNKLHAEAIKKTITSKGIRLPGDSPLYLSDSDD